MMGQSPGSPFFPLLLVAFHVRSDLLGESLVLPELSFCITCSVFLLFVLNGGRGEKFN